MDYKLLYILLFLNAVRMEGTGEEIKKDPKKAFYYSIIPGMGQVYNGKIVKSAFFICLEATAYFSWSENRNKYINFDQNNFPLSKNTYLKKRNKYAWWIGIIYAYSIIDAIVDAHLHPFSLLMKNPIVQEKGKEDTYE